MLDNRRTGDYILLYNKWELNTGVISHGAYLIGKTLTLLDACSTTSCCSEDW
jgi:hypothetical protein